MDYGFSIPTRGALANRESVLALAKRGEELGFAYLAIPDHIVIPRKIDSPYPYNPERKMVGAADGDCLEQLTLMAYLAAATTKIRLLTSVMVVPHRPAVLTAKVLATIDVLSQGRVNGRLRRRLAGGGIRGYRRAAVQRARQGHRRVSAGIQGAVDAGRAALRRPIRALRQHVFLAQAGAEAASSAVDRRRKPGRAAPRGSAGRCLVSDRLQSAISAEHGAALYGCHRAPARRGRAGQRDPAEHRAQLLGHPGTRKARRLAIEDGQRMAFTGSDADVAQDIAAFRALGVRHLLFNFARPTLKESLAAMERFAAKVLPLAGR